MRSKIAVSLAIAFLLSATALAHPGRTDKNGGHWETATGTYHYHTALKDTKIEVYFSPNGGAEQAVVRAIKDAEKSIDIAMYYFTSNEITWVVVEAHEKGRAIRVYLDESQRTEECSKSRFLAERGIPVRFEKGGGLMHNKFAVIDGQVLITGSFNWTASAEERNDGNLLIIGDAALAKVFAGKFEEYWKVAVE